MLSVYQKVFYPTTKPAVPVSDYTKQDTERILAVVPLLLSRGLDKIYFVRCRCLTLNNPLIKIRFFNMT